MALFNRAKFNNLLFNANTQPQSADSALLTEAITSLLVQAVDVITLTDIEANISFANTDSFIESESAIFINLVSDSDTMAESDATFSLTVQASDTSILSDNISAIIASLASTDSLSLSDPAVVIPIGIDSATHSDSVVIPTIASDAAILLELTNLTFAISIVDATVITQTPLATGAGLAVRTTPVLSQVSGVLFVQEKTANGTNGSCIMHVAAGIQMLYEIQLADYSWKPLVTASIVVNGNVGTAARIAAGLTTGSQTLKTITGNLLTLFGLPAQSLLIRMTTSCIDKAGTFRTRELATLPISGGGAVSITLPSTTDLYAPDGTSPLYEIVQNKPNYPRIGKLGFSVPTGAGPFTFGVSNGSIIVH